jgi:UDPglucose 6-dehydrogenase
MTRKTPALSHLNRKTALRDADVVVLVTEWPEFRKIDPVWAASVVRKPMIIDGRNTLDSAAWRAAGCTHVGLGRP